MCLFCNGLASSESILSVGEEHQRSRWQQLWIELQWSVVLYKAWVVGLVRSWLNFYLLFYLLFLYLFSFYSPFFLSLNNYAMVETNFFQSLILKKFTSYSLNLDSWILGSVVTLSVACGMSQCHRNSTRAAEEELTLSEKDQASSISHEGVNGTQAIVGTQPWHDVLVLLVHYRP